MRFGRSTRTLAAVGRRLLGERPEGEQDGVASEERHALLRPHVEETAMEYTSDEPQQLAADPTQRLLTALGRFQRQVNKAESGAPQHLWADECMEQLIEGISIAHENDWHDVKEALTDTARILQSYEDAGVALQAVPFLQDSYEILCLMVGDIIVDNVRSGVMNKWRQRYNHALNDLARHGVSLIDDEAEEPAPAAPANIVRFSQAPASDASRAFPFADPEVEAEADTEETYESEETLEDDSAPTLEVGEEHVDEAEEEAEEEIEEVEVEEDAEADEEIEEIEEELEEEIEAEAEVETADEDATAQEEEPALPALDEVLFEEAEEEAPAMQPEPSNIVRLEEPARAAAAPPVSEQLFDMPAQTPRVADAALVPVRDPDDDVQVMLRSAQQAMSRGDVANAKLVALQVAVKMAELEVSRAKDTLRVAEDRLEDTARAIETASEAVRRTEAGVADVEEQISQRESEFQQKRDHIAGLREHASNVQATIDDIDAQIKALQERREIEERNLAFVQDQLEQGLGAESRIQTDLDMLAQEEEAAREALDAAKQRVRDLQRERLSRESDINDSRHALKNQERSVEDIQRTLRQISSGPEEEPTESGLLF